MSRERGRKENEKTVDPAVQRAEKEKQIVEEFWSKLRPRLSKAGCVRNQKVAELLKVDKNQARGLLVKLVELGHLIDVADPEKNCTLYFSNDKSAYKTAKSRSRLIELVPFTEVERIIDLLEKSSRTVSELSEILYGDPTGKRGSNFLSALLAYYEEKDIVRVSAKSNKYSLSKFAREFGFDEQSIKTLQAIALENQLVMKRKDSHVSFRSLEEVERALRKDLESKTIQPIDVSKHVQGTSYKLMFLAEVLFGNQFTDVELLNWILSRVSPDITIASGLVQGNYLGYRIDKCRVLAWEAGLNAIEAQFQPAGLLNKKLENITRGAVFNVSSDDDWDLGYSYAKLAQKAEGRIWSYGVATGDLSMELKRRLDMLAFYRKWQIQWEYIIPYQYRVGRSLLNSDEVFEKIGVKKSEYRLIVEILVAEKHKFSYPEEYKQVVDLDALFGRNGKKRVVTPDNLILQVPDGKGGFREVQFVHNTAFSNITQYVDSLYPVESAMRNLGARPTMDGKLPWIIADGHQERFYATYLQGHWIMNMPGMQNPILSSRYRMKEFNTRILSSKSHRQNTFRKEPVTPGAVEMEILGDGRIRFRLFNNAIKEVLESQRGKPEVRIGVALPTDLQHASITMFPEMEIKYLDYALYERGAQKCYENGDILHGFIYPQHIAENRPNRLVSVDSQQRFTLAIQMPLIINAPKLDDFLSWLGNHEWGIWGNNITGTNALFPLEAYMKGYLAGMEKSGRKLDMRAGTVSRIRWMKTHNPGGGDKVNWPFFATEVAGFKMAMTHIWSRQGRTPVDKQRVWLSNMATACGDIHVMFGGHYHSVWMAQVAEKWLVQMAASAGQSGYELGMGLMSTVMFTFAEFSNRDGIMIEFVPWEFLEQYKCQCPFYKGKDKDLELPKKGSTDYQYGKNSPLIEHMIDETTQYLEI